MTTIIGIKTTSGSVDAVVMGADTRRVYFDNNNNPVGYGTCTKFIHREGAPWIMAYAGWETPHYYRFYQQLIGTVERELHTTVELGDLVEGRTHAPFAPVARLALKHEYLTDQTRILLASSTSKNGVPEIWNFSDGRLRKYRGGKKGGLRYASIGEGEIWVRRILGKFGVPRNAVTFEKAVELVQFALDFSQGSYTRGYQLAIVTPHGVELGPRFGASQRKAWSDYCEEVVKKYTGKRKCTTTEVDRIRRRVLKERLVLNKMRTNGN